MTIIDHVGPDFQLGESDLCLTPQGWLHELFTVLIELSGMTLEQALEALWQQHQGLLGEGVLSFKLLELAPKPRGYIVFTPTELG